MPQLLPAALQPASPASGAAARVAASAVGVAPAALPFLSLPPSAEGDATHAPAQELVQALAGAPAPGLVPFTKLLAWLKDVCWACCGSQAHTHAGLLLRLRTIEQELFRRWARDCLA